MICVIDYGVGNLRSVLNAVAKTGADVELISTPEQVLKADKLILPGVGAYGACMDSLNSKDGLSDAIKTAIDNGVPVLGICVGMQILSTIGKEFNDNMGLDIIPGEVREIKNPDNKLKVPHMGWNTINVLSEHSVLDGLDGEDVYFVHSYVFDTNDKKHTIASCSYGEEFSAVVCKGNVIASQFHPEKSQKVGLRLIENFVKWKP